MAQRKEAGRDRRISSPDADLYLGLHSHRQLQASVEQRHGMAPTTLTSALMGRWRRCYKRLAKKVRWNGKKDGP